VNEPHRQQRLYRVTAPATHPLTGQGGARSVEVRTARADAAKRVGIARLRDAGWEVDGVRATVREVVPVVGVGTPAQRLRALRDALGEDRATFARRFLVPADATQLHRWELGATMRSFELETLAYLERAAFGRM
jgi:hypothetical protein